MTTGAALLLKEIRKRELWPQLVERLKYSADEPRVPAGSPGGGEWTSGGGGSFSADRAVAATNALPQFVPTDGSRLIDLTDKDYRANPLPTVGQPVGKMGAYTDARENVEIAFHAAEKLDVRTVPIDQLVTFQRYVNADKVRLLAQTVDQWLAQSHSDLPIVLPYEGRQWLIDGNHRVVALKLGGAQTAKVQYYELPVLRPL